MKRFDHQGTDRLRRGRVSIPGARYFITVCSAQRKTGLQGNETTRALIEALRELHRSANISLHCATVMPDHMHVLFTLGRNLSLAQTQGKFKANTADALKAIGVVWQDNFDDHRLRHESTLENFARYTFLNPYRKQLIPLKDTWPGWVLNRHYRPEFTRFLVEGHFPPHQWLKQSSSIQDLINQDLNLSESPE